MHTSTLSQIWPINEPHTLTPLTNGINNLTYRVETPNGSYILRMYRTTEDPRKVDLELAVLDALGHADLSFGVPVPLHTRSGNRLARMTGPNGESLATLVPVIPGTHPVLDNPAHPFAAGRALGELARGLATIPLTPDPAVVSNYGDLARISPAMPNPVADVARFPVEPAVHARLSRLMEDLLEKVPSLYASLPLQMIHGDFVPSNVLMSEDDRVSAVLDFENTCRDCHALDLGSAMIAWSSGRWGTGREWEALEAVVRGYVSQQPLTSEEAAALPDLIRLRRAVICLHLGGRHLQGAGPVELLHYGVNTALETEDWLTANSAEFARRLHTWSR